MVGQSSSTSPLKKRRRSYDNLMTKFQTPGVQAGTSKHPEAATVDMTRESSADISEAEFSAEDNAGVDEVNRKFDEINNLYIFSSIPIPILLFLFLLLKSGDLWSPPDSQSCN